MAPKAVPLHLHLHLVLVPLLSLLPFSSLALTQDFCVANLLLPDTPAGYPCKPKLLVTSDDFYSRDLAKPGPTIPPFNTSLVSAFAQQLPGLNGLGLGATRVDILPGGVVPLHTHPEGTELLLCLDGTITAGFVSAETNTVYTKTLKKYEVFVFPQALLHFQYNTDNTTAVAFAAYSNQNPGLQIVDFALFKSDLPADVVTKTTFIDRVEVRRLKKQFGGSG